MRNDEWVLGVGCWVLVLSFTSTQHPTPRTRLSFITHHSAFIISLSSYHELRRRDDGAGFGVVVVVNLRRRGERADAVARREGEGEACLRAAVGPEVENEAVGKNVVAFEARVCVLERALKRGAVNFSAGRESDFGEQHPVAARAARHFDRAVDGLAGVAFGSVEARSEERRVG